MELVAAILVWIQVNLMSVLNMTSSDRKTTFDICLVTPGYLKSVSIKLRDVQFQFSLRAAENDVERSHPVAPGNSGPVQHCVAWYGHE